MIKNDIGTNVYIFKDFQQEFSISKTAKGIKKIVNKKDNKHEDYKNTLFNGEQMYHAMKTIRSDNH